VTAGWLLGAALATTCVTLARVLDARDRLGDSPAPNPWLRDPVTESPKVTPE